MIGQPRNPTSSTAPDGKSCPNCGAAIPAGGCWCPRCGQQLADPCWECGRPLEAGARVCAFCGTAAADPAIVQCRQCGAISGRGFVFCTGCGAQIRQACEECERPMRREWRFCPTCGGSPVQEAAGAAPGEVEIVAEEPEAPAAPGRAPGGNADELNRAAVRAYEREEYQEAARLFEEAIRVDPTNPGYYTNLGVAYGELGDELQAFAAYRKAVELNPGELQAYLNMGYLYAERERAAEAREMWETVIRLAPDSDEAREARECLGGQDEV